jgi:hypothetical protein
VYSVLSHPPRTALRQKLISGFSRVIGEREPEHIKESLGCSWIKRDEVPFPVGISMSIVLTPLSVLGKTVLGLNEISLSASVARVSVLKVA